jgi:hypothetical protein
MARLWSELLPISGRRESVKIKERMAIQHGVRDANNALQAEQSYFVEFVSTQQIGVVAKISQEPAEPPQCFRCAIDPARQGMAAVLFGLENREAQEVKRSGGMPTIERTINTDEEDTFKLIRAISTFAMQAGNVVRHELTSCGTA